MPKVRTIACEIKTGDVGTTSDVYLVFNGHPVQFSAPTGGTGATETFAGTFAAMSVAHSVTLLGPAEGAWHIDEIAVTYELEGDAPYTVRFGPVALDTENQVSIWAEPPRPTFDV
jgi:hypothetical protein